MFNRIIFFDQLRESVFRGRFSQSQVDGLNALLDAWEESYGHHPSDWLAYSLATCYHETAATMQPIAEYGRGRGRKYGRPDRVTGRTYYGRGYVQLTWKRNYAAFAQRTGLDLVNQPDLAMQPDVAAQILYEGMIDGVFTQKAFGDYITGASLDFRRARQIVNGMDKASLIAGYADAFKDAIDMALAQAPKSVDRVPETTAKPAHKSTTGWSAVGQFILSAISGVTAFFSGIAETLGPWPTVAVLALLLSGSAFFGLWIIKERRLKAYRFGE